jgi:hypothetical protein
MLIYSGTRAFRFLKFLKNKNDKMINYFPVYTLFLMFVFHTSCGQNQTNVPQDNIVGSPKNSTI